MTLNFDRLFDVDQMVADPNSKNGLLKKLNFHLPNISALALYTESLELGPAPPVKSRKFDQKIDFFLKSFSKKNPKS